MLPTEVPPSCHVDVRHNDQYKFMCGLCDFYMQLKFHAVIPSVCLFPFFPGSCILQVWDHGAALRPCSCPLCRREITLLVPSEAHHTPDAAEILQRIERYNHLYGARPNNIMQVVLVELLKNLLFVSPTLL